jgi:uncharacterized protein YfaP (DUF2135 family)
MVVLTVTDDCGPWKTFVGVGQGAAPRGTVTGTVRSALGGQPVAGATVSVRGTQRTGTTSATGAFAISEVQPGSVSLDVTASGFTAGSATAMVQPGQATTVDVNLTPAPASQVISIALTWGTSPDDLDLHLSGPTPNGLRFHLYWNNPDVASYTTISEDDHDGGGPETATIGKRPSTGAWVPGQYRVWTHNYSILPGFGGSSANVTVSRGGQELGVYNVVDATGNPLLGLWRSVNLTLDANGELSLTSVQQFVNGGENTVLRLADGPDGALEWPATGKR